MSDLKIIERLTKPMRMLGDAELGRLVRAMLDYLVDGTDTDLRGNERFLWDDARASIDRQRRTAQARSKAGTAGMESRWNNKPITNDNNSITNDNNGITNDSKEKEAKRNIYISTTSRELKDSDSVDIRDDSLSRDSSRDSTTPLLEKDKAKEPTRSRKPSNTTVLDGFDTFWLIYPNKKAKKDARKAWEKIKPNEELQQTIIAAVNEQKQSKQWIEGYVPYPATWLNGERWNDVTKPMDRLAHLRDLYEQEVANDNAGYGADVRGDSDPVSTGNGFFDFLKGDGR